MSKQAVHREKLKGLAPAFQSYAAIELGVIISLGLRLCDVGLLHRVKLAQFMGYPLPADPERLARVIGEDAALVRDMLEILGEPQVVHDRSVVPEMASIKGGPLLVVCDGLLLCPEVERQMGNLEWTRARQSDGGKRGAARKYGRGSSELQDAGEGSSYG